MEEQLTRVVALLRETLGDALTGLYLFGSATDGGLRPTSDLDILGVLRRRTTREQRRRLIGALLELSMQPRFLEVTLVVASEVRPWRYPPRMELQYGDWWRGELERGLEPWPDVNPDLATLLAMVLRTGRTLHGPPPEELLYPVPTGDVVRAATDGLDKLFAEIEDDTRNVLLTLARIWVTAATGEISSKDEAAAWALERLPPDHRAALERARAGYLAGDYGRWDDVDARGCADAIVAAARASGSGRDASAQDVPGPGPDMS